MSTKTTGLAPKSSKPALAKLIILCLLALGLYLVFQDPTGSAEAVNSGWSSLTTFSDNLDIGGDQR